MRYELNIDLGTLKAGTTCYPSEHFHGNGMVMKLSFDSKIINFNDQYLEQFLADGIIREVEEPKWTDSQMIDNMEEYANHLSSDTDCGYLTASQWLERKLNRLKSKQEEGI